MNTHVPTLKFEGVPDDHVKLEPVEDTPSPYMDDLDDANEDAGDVDFSQAQQQYWLSHIPKSLWEALAQISDDQEIDLGTIRVEGSEANPSRVSLLLNRNLPQLTAQPKEYNLVAPPPEKVRGRKPGQALIFSEKDLVGYKSKSFGWDDLDEEGNPGQGRSFLHERHKREIKRKENKGRFQPYSRKPIPKQTTIMGAVMKEFTTAPVKNNEYFELEKQQSLSMLKPKERPQAEYAKEDPTRMQTGFLSMAERATINRANQNRKQAAKEVRAARMERPQLIDALLDLFKQHRIWGLRDLKARVQQPESFLRSVLEEIAFMWRQGDWNGKWELKDEYKHQDIQLQNPTGMVAPKAEDTDAEKSGGDDDEDVSFVDV